MTQSWVARLDCWIRLRHDDLVQFAPGRMYSVCQHCGRETPGWRLGLPTIPAFSPKLTRFRRRLRQARTA